MSCASSGHITKLKQSIFALRYLWLMESVQARKPYRKGRLSTVELLVLSSLDQLLFIMKALLTFLTKQSMSMRGSTVLCFPLQLVFPGLVKIMAVIHKYSL
jgi:hypothetical protein